MTRVLKAFAVLCALAIPTAFVACSDDDGGDCTAYCDKVVTCDSSAAGFRDLCVAACNASDEAPPCKTTDECTVFKACVAAANGGGGGTDGGTTTHTDGGAH